MFLSLPHINIVSSGHSALDHRLFDKEAQTLKSLSSKIRIIANYSDSCTIDGVEIHSLHNNKSRLYRFLITPWKCLNICLKYQTPIIHIHDLELLMICPILKLLGQKIIIYDVHEDFGKLMLRRDWIPTFLRRAIATILEIAERMLALSVDGIIGVTDPLTAKFWNHRKISIYNLPSSFLLRMASSSLPTPEKRIYDLVHLGTLSHERLVFLGQIIRILLRLRPEIKILVVGLRSEQVHWARKSFPNCADIIGKVPYHKVPAYLIKCRIGINIHPILYPHLKVAVPAKIFEYMACGCNVVTSYLPELDRLLDEETKKNISIIKNGDPSVYAHRINQMLSQRERLVANQALLTRKVVEKYNWNTEAKKLILFYQQLLKENLG